MNRTTFLYIAVFVATAKRYVPPAQSHRLQFGMILFCLFLARSIAHHLLVRDNVGITQPGNKSSRPHCRGLSCAGAQVEAVGAFGEDVKLGIDTCLQQHRVEIDALVRGSKLVNTSEVTP